MSIAKGYKQTEVGVIPEDWEVKRIIDISLLKSGLSITANEISEIGGYSCYGGNGLRGFTKKFTHNGKYPIIGRQGALCGNINYVEGKFFASEHAVVVSVNNQTDAKWLSYVMIRMNLNQYSESSAQPGLSVNKIGILKIPFPLKKNEQTAIANALSDMDALIAQTEKLIEKKKAIKQGVMQELLQPKEGWVTKKLGEVANFFKGVGLPKSDLSDFGRFKCIHYGELFTSYKEQIVNIKNRTNKNIGVFFSKTNDVLMPTSDVTPNGLATASCISENEVILGGDILIIRCDSNIVDGVFLSYSIRYNRQQIMQLVSGSTVYHLYGSDMSRFNFSFPDLETQKAASRLLIEMENEINKFQTKLQKLKNQKQGMMQALLTGKIRLV